MLHIFVSKVALLTFILLCALPTAQLTDFIYNSSPDSINYEKLFSTLVSPCPDIGDINPCQCIKKCIICPYVIECFNITSLNQLNDVLQKSGDFPFRDARFHNMSIPYLPSHSLLSKKYLSLTIKDSVQISLFDEPPANNSPLQEIHLENIKLQRSVEWKLFSNFRHLISINITGIPLKKVKNLVGESLPNQIEQIILIKTETNCLGDNAFEPMKQLRYLEVSQSKLSTIKRSMFPRPFIGTGINLSGNNISSLPADFFSDMPFLMAIELSNNFLKRFSNSVFGNLPPSLLFLFLAGNPIICDCSIEWITKQRITYIIGWCSEPPTNEGKFLFRLNSRDFAYC